MRQRLRRPFGNAASIASAWLLTRSRLPVAAAIVAPFRASQWSRLARKKPGQVSAVIGDAARICP